MVAWLLVGAAQARTEICADIYRPVELAAAIGLATDALADEATAEARRLLDAAVERLPCLTEVVGAEQFARFARVMALACFREERPPCAERWAAASRAAAPLRWSYVYDPEHPFRVLFEQAPMPEPQESPAVVRAPEGGGAFLNGQLLERAVLRPGLPSLVQVFDEQQRPVDGWWQTGEQYPSRMLDGRGKVPPPPLWWKGDGPTSARYRPLGVVQPRWVVAP